MNHSLRSKSNSSLIVLSFHLIPAHINHSLCESFPNLLINHYFQVNNFQYLQLIEEPHNSRYQKRQFFEKDDAEGFFKVHL